MWATIRCGLAEKCVRDVVQGKVCICYLGIIRYPWWLLHTITAEMCALFHLCTYFSVLLGIFCSLNSRTYSVVTLGFFYLCSFIKYKHLNSLSPCKSEWKICGNLANQGKNEQVWFMNWNGKLVKLLVMESSCLHPLARSLKIPFIIMLPSSGIFSYLGEKKKKISLRI